MPIKGENGGYKYKAFINGEWHDLTLSDSPNELTEWLQSNEEWTRVKHGHWVEVQRIHETDHTAICECSLCGDTVWVYDGQRAWNYCPNCGAKMDEVADDES